MVSPEQHNPNRVALEEVEQLAICTTCGNPYDPDNIRETHPYRHLANGPLPSKGEKSPEKNQNSDTQLPFDPILRLVLIEKGIITVDDLTEAEQKLMASGMVINNPNVVSVPPTSRSPQA